MKRSKSEGLNKVDADRQRTDLTKTREVHDRRNKKEWRFNDVGIGCGPLAKNRKRRSYRSCGINRFEFPLFPRVWIRRENFRNLFCERIGLDRIKSYGL